MRLRNRLILGYAYLVALLLVAAGSAMIGFFNLSAGIDTILKENVRSIQASTRMLAALERQDSASLAELLGGTPRLAEMQKYERDFDQALVDAEENITEAEETEVLENIRNLYETYRSLRGSVMRSEPGRPLGGYGEEVLPAFNDVRAEVLKLLDVNHAAMVRADDRAKEDALRNGLGLGLLVAVALLTSALLSRGMQRQILQRLDELKGSMEAIVARDPDRRLNPRGEDELADIARHFNALLDANAKLRAGSESRLVLERQISLALLARYGPGTAILSLTGEQIAGDPQFADDETETALEEWTRNEGRRICDALPKQGRSNGEPPRHTHAGCSLELLVAPGGRPAGWLVRAGKSEAAV